MEMAKAGEAVNVREIQIFTQKGLYARRIMDEMGLAELNQESQRPAGSPLMFRRGAWARS